MNDAASPSTLGRNESALITAKTTALMPMPSVSVVATMSDWMG